ncbi:MAG: hypothetical protein LAT57_11825 [Balneolales bacterium]|nr:hypothetical protein [Balneolales bacterium]
MIDSNNRIRNQLRDSADSPSSQLDVNDDRNHNELDDPLFRRRKKRPFRNFLLIGLIAFSGLYFFNTSESVLNPFTWSTGSVFSPGPSDDLLTRMNNRLVEMGYVGYTHDDLRELRSEGLTATYISNIRALGYNDLSMDDARKLAKAGASSAFVAMMIELGYTLSVDELVMLRDAGVTAHFTSNMQDLGYTDIPVEQLIRLRRIGVTPALVRRLQGERGQDVGLEEIIRYRISNQ